MGEAPTHASLQATAPSAPPFSGHLTNGRTDAIPPAAGPPGAAGWQEVHPAEPVTPRMANGYGNGVVEANGALAAAGQLHGKGSEVGAQQQEEAEQLPTGGGPSTAKQPSTAPEAAQGYGQSPASDRVSGRLMRYMKDQAWREIKKRFPWQDPRPAGLLYQLGWSCRLVPMSRGSHVTWFTMTFLATCCGLFAFMSTNYCIFLLDPEYGTGEGRDRTGDITSAEDKCFPVQPSTFTAFINLRSSSWTTFRTSYLISWGARTAEALKDGEWWRWFTSVLIHTNFNHLLSNMLLFVAVTLGLEHNYALWRVLFVAVLSALGGNFMSAAFESPCSAVVGASGLCFGFVGMFAADAVLNFESLAYPLLRILIVLAFMGYFIASIATDSSGGKVSHMSHIGGLVCGLFPSFIFLPNVQARRHQKAKGLVRRIRFTGAGVSTHRRILRDISSSVDRNKSCWSQLPFNPLVLVGVLVVVFFLGILPIYIYADVLPGFDYERECVSSENEAAGLPPTFLLG